MLYMFEVNAEIASVYEQLKDRYDLVLTTTAELNEGFTIDSSVIVGKAHGLIFQLYDDGDMLVMSIMNEEKTMGTHGHPWNVEQAVEKITEFMEGICDYRLYPFGR